jgi:DtxR family Mn-dependent transcriptional regulator
MGASSTVENYLKAIHQGMGTLPADQRRLPMGQLASSLGVTPGTATAMVKTLAESGLVDYEPYAGVNLTPAGRKLAALVLRRHRLIELFLVEVMGFSWDEVHEDAEQLEHVVSDRLVDRMDEMLGRPETDPHGDPIPDPDGVIKKLDAQSLLTCPLNTPVTVTRVLDQDGRFLRFLDRHDLRPGTRIEIAARDAAGDSVQVRAEGDRLVTIGTRAASKLLVQVAHVLALVLLWAASAAAQPAPTGGTATPFRILDNAFLVEEAFNQEAGVFQNIVGVNLGPDGTWETAFTQEWPLGGWRHQASYTVPLAATRLGAGLGDVQLHYRYQALVETATAPAFSPRVTVILPSGDAARELGGHAGWQVNLPFSKQVGDGYLHWNAGVTHLPGADDGTVTPYAAVALMWRARPMLHPMLETLVEWEEQPEGRVAVWTIAPGVRTGWDIGETQTILGLAVPVVVGNGRADAGGFLYLSYELPFGAR